MQGIRSLALLLTLAALAVGACARSPSAATPAPTPVPSPAEEVSLDREPPAEVGEDELAEGYRLYVATGCAACHGMEGEGTDIAPPLAGHTEEQVKRQVRRPLFRMPAFGPDRLSDEELEKIARWVASLAVAEAHPEPVEVADLATMHLWMAYLALQGENMSEFRHHAEHALENLPPEREEWRPRIRRVQEEAEAGDLHGAEHELEGLVGTVPGMGPARLHTQMALSALASRDIEDLRHHLRHLEEVAEGWVVEKVEEVKAALEKGDLHEVEHILEEIRDGLAGAEGQEVEQEAVSEGDH